MGIKDFLADKALDAAAYVGAAGPSDNPVENIGNAIGLVGAAIGGAYKKKMKRIEDDYIAKRPNNKHIYIRMEVSDGRVEFKVTDLDGNILYTASGKLTKRGVSFIVKSAPGTLIGKVKKTILTIRNPLEHEKNPANFVITLADSNTITVKTTQGINDYEIVPYGWKTGYESGCRYVSNGDEPLFYYDSWGYQKYMVDYKHSSIEKQAVLICMAIMAQDYWEYLQDD